MKKNLKTHSIITFLSSLALSFAVFYTATPEINQYTFSSQRAPSASKKAAVKELLKRNGFIVRNNAIKGISPGQAQDLLTRGKTTKLRGLDYHKVKIDRTGPRFVLSEDKSTVVFASNKHGEYDRFLSKLPRKKK